MDISIYYWLGFFLFVIIMLVLDLGVFNKKEHVISIKEALIWSWVWISFAMIFNYIIYHQFWGKLGLEFLAWYVIEKSLSVDNLFVFIMIFSYFHIKKSLQHKILFWWIIWALLMRAVFIWAWIKLIENFHFVIYIFWWLLIFSWIKMLFESEEEEDLEKKWVVKLLRKLIPIAKHNDDGHFFIRIDGKLYATTMFITLIMIEISDLIFAIDSVPAVLAISNNMFIVYTSNIFAILWLRSLYFALNSFMSYFHYLRYWLAAILSFVWIKMIIWGMKLYEISIGHSLWVIWWILFISVVASYIFPQKKEI